jgi:hypothetical protein
VSTDREGRHAVVTARAAARPVAQEAVRAVKRKRTPLTSRSN